MFENTSHQPLTLVARLEHPAVRDMKKSRPSTSDPVTMSMLTGQCWVPKSGDRITLENSDFQDLERLDPVEPLGARLPALH